MKVTQSCPTLCNAMDCSLQAPLSMEFFRKELLEWVATSFSKGIFPSQKIEGNLQVSLNAGRLFTV